MKGSKRFSDSLGLHPNILLLLVSEIDMQDSLVFTDNAIVSEIKREQRIGTKDGNFRLMMKNCVDIGNKIIVVY